MKDKDITKVFMKFKNESPPDLDVTDSVMEIITGNNYRFVNETSRPLLLMAAASTAVAAALMIIAAISVKTGQQPLVDLINQIEWVM